MKHLNTWNEALADFRFSKFSWKNVTLDVLEPISDEDVIKINIILSLFKDEGCIIDYFAGSRVGNVQSAFYIRVRMSSDMDSSGFIEMSNDVGRRLEETGLFKNWTTENLPSVNQYGRPSAWGYSHFVRKKINDEPYLLWG